MAGKQRAFNKKFKFIVEIDSFAVSAWTKAGPLEAEVGVVEQREGGSLIAVKEPGLVTFPELTLERGATDDLDSWNWFKTVADLARNAGLVSPDYKKTLDIVQQDRDSSTLKRWRLYNAWPKKFSAGEWDNDADENVMEQLVLVYDYFDLITAAA